MREHRVRCGSAGAPNGLASPPEPAVVSGDSYLPQPCLLHPEQVGEHQDNGLRPPDLERRIRVLEKARDG